MRVLFCVLFMGFLGGCSSLSLVQDNAVLCGDRYHRFYRVNDLEQVIPDHLTIDALAFYLETCSITIK